MFDLERTNSAG